MHVGYVLVTTASLCVVCVAIVSVPRVRVAAVFSARMSRRVAARAVRDVEVLISVLGRSCGLERVCVCVCVWPQATSRGLSLKTGR